MLLRLFKQGGIGHFSVLSGPHRPALSLRAAPIPGLFSEAYTLGSVFGFLFVGEFTWDNNNSYCYLWLLSHKYHSVTADDKILLLLGKSSAEGHNSW